MTVYNSEDVARWHQQAAAKSPSQIALSPVPSRHLLVPQETGFPAAARLQAAQELEFAEVA